jgi:hypothetical protein
MVHVVIADQKEHVPFDGRITHVLHEDFERLQVIHYVNLGSFMKQIAKEKHITAIFFDRCSKDPIQNLKAMIQSINSILVSVQMKICLAKHFHFGLLFGNFVQIIRVTSGSKPKNTAGISQPI